MWLTCGLKVWLKGGLKVFAILTPLSKLKGGLNVLNVLVHPVSVLNVADFSANKAYSFIKSMCMYKM